MDLNNASFLMVIITQTDKPKFGPTLLHREVLTYPDHMLMREDLVKKKRALDPNFYSEFEVDIYKVDISPLVSNKCSCNLIASGTFNEALKEHAKLLIG
ncbi:MAG: hypothetical protein WC444_05220 [Candidatus Paceibacterota bacterium]